MTNFKLHKGCLIIITPTAWTRRLRRLVQARGACRTRGLWDRDERFQKKAFSHGQIFGWAVEDALRLRGVS